MVSTSSNLSGLWSSAVAFLVLLLPFQLAIFVLCYSSCFRLDNLQNFLLQPNYIRTEQNGNPLNLLIQSINQSVSQPIDQSVTKQYTYKIT